jgi:hypothetical protein
LFKYVIAHNYLLKFIMCCVYKLWLQYVIYV